MIPGVDDSTSSGATRVPPLERATSPQTAGAAARIAMLGQWSGVPAVAQRVLQSSVEIVSSTPESNRQIRWLFLRVLGLTYLAAFGSLRAQLRGLYGSLAQLAPHRIGDNGTGRFLK